MDYSKLNGLLSSLEIDEPKLDNNETNHIINDTINVNINVKDKEKDNEYYSDKKKINNFLCFRDIDLKKNINTVNTDRNILKPEESKKHPEINNILNNRVFDIKNNNTAPIMEFYPKFTRNENNSS